MSINKAVVVGGGFLGLSAAVGLCRAGYTVDLIEAAPELGGLARPIDFDGDLIEMFYHFFYSGDSKFAEDFLKLIDAPRDVHWSKIQTATYMDGIFVDFDSVISILQMAGSNSPQLLKTLFRLKFFKPAPSLDNISAVDWARINLGHDFAEKVWIPLLKSKYGIHHEKSSALWLATRIKRHMSTKVGLKSKFGYLTPTYAPAIEICETIIKSSGGKIFKNERIESISSSETRIEGLATSKQSIELTKNHKLITTIPFANLKNVKGLESQFSAFESVGAVIVLLKLAKKLSDYYWTTVTDKDIEFNAVIQQNRLWPVGKYEHVYLSRYNDLTQPALTMPDREILKIYLEGLNKIFPHFNMRDVVSAKVFRSNGAAPVPFIKALPTIPGFKDRLENFYHAGFEQILPEDRGVGNSIELGNRLSAIL